MNSNIKKSFTTIDAKEFDTRAQKENRVVLDVRTPYENMQERIDGSLLIPHNELPERVSELEQYKECEILVYCHAGMRSLAACYYLVESGFTKVYNLRGGIDEWTYAGKEVVRG